MVTDFNNQNTVSKKDMEQMMHTIYDELRELFFRHVHRVLPPFIDCKAPEIVLLNETTPEILGEYSLEQVIAEIDIEKIEAMMARIRRDDRSCVGWLGEAVEILGQIIRGCKRGEFEDKNRFGNLLRRLCYSFDRTKELAGVYFNNDDCKKIIEEIIKEIEKAIYLLKNIKKEVAVLGEFSAEDWRITLYIETNKRCRGNSTLRNRMLATLAHELFHAMHYVVGKDKWNKKLDKKRDKVRKTVVESLARWAEYCWCKHQNQAEFEYLVRKMQEEWEIRDFSSDPYSGAKVFDNEGVIDLDIEVLNDSIKSWNKAYKKMELHRNDKVLKERIDEEVHKLRDKLIDEQSIFNLHLNEWAIIHLHDAAMSERYNVTVSELIQYELEQRGFEVACIPCKEWYLKRNNEKGWGKSALLFIINGKLIPTKCFIEEIDSVESKYVNINSSFIRAVLLLNELDVVHFRAKDANKGNVGSWDKRYGAFHRYWIFDVFEDILNELRNKV